MKKFLSLIFSLLLFVSVAKAQTGEVTVSFNEQFFDSLLDAIFTNLKQPDFPLAANRKPATQTDFEIQNSKFKIQNTFLEIQNPKSKIPNPLCDQKIVLQREMSGVRTGVRFRDGQIYAPIAFSGSYSPPFIGCVDFQGYAETNIELEFDREKQALIGRVRVTNVQLGSVANMAGGVLAKFVQNTIDKKINPIEILRADKLVFIVPVQNSDGALKLRATNLRHEIGNGVLNVHVDFEFSKAD
jgi:hypothetical protein